MRIAEQERSRARGKCTLEGLEVERPAPFIVLYKRNLDEVASGGAYDLEERRVHRRIDNDARARLRERAQTLRYTRHNVGNRENTALVERPIEALCGKRCKRGRQLRDRCVTAVR